MKKLPYQPIRQVGKMYFLAGHTPVDQNDATVRAGISNQTIDCIQNLEKTLNSEGLTLDDLVKTTVFLKNMSDFDEMNQEYAKAFNGQLPVRSTVEVSDLPHIAKNGHLLIEIEAIAVKK